MDTCKKLANIISLLIDRKEYSLVNTDKLKIIFFENLSEVFKIAFDINLDLIKLKAFTQEKSTAPDFVRIGQFLAETLEKKETYIVINYYLYLFLQSYLNTVKTNYLNDINTLMLKQGLSEDEVENIKKDYWNLVKKKSVSSPTQTT